MPLPYHPDVFIGRSAERARLTAALDDGRAAVLIGPGGIGKTRLAVEIAAARSEPALYVDLAGARTDEDVCSAVLSALDAAGRLGSDPVEAVGARLAREGARTLILDNTERVAGPVAAAVPRWLAQAPGLWLLLTSRRQLLAPACVEVTLAPLLPEDAVRLFVARTPQRPMVPLHAEDDAAVIEAIATRLEGIPLALELAAARLEVLPVAELARRLDQGFAVLRAPTSRVPRHAALRDAITWSWDALHPAEQDALAQASVFRDGFGLEAAEAVLALPDGFSALDALHALKRWCLLQSAPRDGRARFRMLDTIREFAAEALAAREAVAATRARHAAWFLDRARGWSRVLQPEDPPGVRRFIRADHENLVAALEHLAEDPARWPDVAQVLVALGRLSSNQRRQTWFLGWSAQALAPAAPVSDPPRQVALLLHQRAGVLRAAERLPEAVECQRQAVAIAEALGDRRLTGTLYGYLGSLFSILGDDAGAQFGYERALALARDLDAPDLEAQALIALSQCVDLRQRGDPEAAERRLLHAAALAEQAGRSLIACSALQKLGALLCEAGRLDEALEVLERAARRLAAIPDRPVFEVDVRLQLALLYHLRGQAADARAALQQARVVMQAQETPLIQACGAVCSGLIAPEALDTGALTGLEQAEAVLAGAASMNQPTLAAGQGLLAGALARLGRTRQAQAVDARITEPAWRAYAEAHQHIAAAGRAAAGGEPEAAHAALDAARQRRAGLTGRALLLCAGALALDRALQACAEGVEVWFVAADGAWFAPPGGARVSLARRPTLQPILAALLEARLAQPGEPLPQDALLEVGWPGERVVPRAARSRIYTAVRTLRRFGLDILERARDGYLLDAEAPVRRA
ncbi:MAG: tetratricopeptide repeat protein [Alphaproteobacteria bacterium]|nr:tetratricopeptide repeat protein [Alphaproteobacteria bacterium]